MSYATPEQFIRAFSEREARTLTDEDMTGFIDEEKLASALARASAQIDGYLVGRYRTPWPDSPGILVGYCCDIARYHLATDYRISSEEIQMRYRDAIRYLEKVAAGQNQPRAGYVRQRDPVIVTRGVSAPAPVSFGRESTRGGAF